MCENCHFEVKMTKAVCHFLAICCMGKACNDIKTKIKGQINKLQQKLASK